MRFEIYFRKNFEKMDAIYEDPLENSYYSNPVCTWESLSISSVTSSGRLLPIDEDVRLRPPINQTEPISIRTFPVRRLENRDFISPVVIPIRDELTRRFSDPPARIPPLFAPDNSLVRSIDALSDRLIEIQDSIGRLNDRINYRDKTITIALVLLIFTSYALMVLAITKTI